MGRDIKFAKYLCDTITTTSQEEYNNRLMANVEIYKQAIIDGYVITIDTISEMLDLQHQYIQRNILNPDIVDYIAIHPQVRQELIKWVDSELEGGRIPPIERWKLRKKVLICKNSFIRFLNSAIHKVGDYITFEYIIDSPEYSEAFTDLLKKFKNINRVKGAMKNIETQLNEDCKYKMQYMMMFDAQDIKLYSSVTLKRKLNFTHDMQLYRFLHKRNYSKFNLIIHSDKKMNHAYNRKSLQDYPMARYNLNMDGESTIFNEPVREEKEDIIYIQLERTALEQFSRQGNPKQFLFNYIYEILMKD